jgi:isoleucyl-tRNA synthetase
MYQNLVRSVNVGYESVHLDSYPQADSSKIDQRLSDATRLAMRLSSLGRAARSKAGIKVRQPLKQVLVKLRSPDEAELLAQVAAQVQDELNVKALVPFSDDNEVMEFKAQANMPLLGPKYGKELRSITSALSAADASVLHALASPGQTVEIDGYTLEPEEILVTSSDKEGYSVASEGGYTVAVTTEVGEELALEGLARELVHRIQNMRRSAGFDITDHIVTYYQASPRLDDVMSAHGDYIREETLSREVVTDQPPQDAYSETHKINDVQATLGVKRLG